MDNNILKKTTKLWTQAVEEELVEDIEADVAIGAHYAQLALDGTVELTESGVVKVEAALEALSELVGDD